MLLSEARLRLKTASWCFTKGIFCLRGASNWWQESGLPVPAPTRQVLKQSSASDLRKRLSHLDRQSQRSPSAGKSRLTAAPLPW